MDKFKDKYFPVLDNGFCALVDYMGDDNAIARAARCSYGAGTKKVSNNRGLIRTLMRDMHTSPLEMCEIVLHVGLPIFVARQWVRHRTASLNEYSGRYSVMPMMFYTPEYQRHQTQSQTNKQGSSKLLLGEVQYAIVSKSRERARTSTEVLYRDCLGVDLTRELARIDLPLSTYTYWYWKIDLKNLLHFLRLRLDSHAQPEIQEYAKVIAGMVREWLPNVWEAFEDYVLNGIHLSWMERDVLRDAFNSPYPMCEFGDEYFIESCQERGMSMRETKGFIEKLNIMSCGVDCAEDIPKLDIDEARPASFYENLIEQHVKE
jgi:thymidylate synthase (FAD)